MGTQITCEQRARPFHTHETISVIRLRGFPHISHLPSMKSPCSSFLPAPGKLLLALPAVFGASSASAVIIYTDFGPDGVTAVKDNAATMLSFDFNGNYDLSSQPSSSYDFSLYVKAANANPTILDINLDGSSTAVAQVDGMYLLGPGQVIGPDLVDGLTFMSREDDVFSVSTTPTLGTSYYIGLQSNGNYGWAKMMLSFDVNSDSLITLFGVAYDNSGASILTGDTGASAVPEPGVTAAFAGLVAGAAAAFAARRKRKAKASADVA